MENFDFLIFRIVVTVRDLKFDRKSTHPDSALCKSVLLHLATYCSSPDGSRIFPGLQLLAASVGCHEQSVRRALAWLTGEGYIVPERVQRGHVKGHALVMDTLGLTLEDTQVKRKVSQPAAPKEEESYPDYEDGLSAADVVVPGSARDRLRAVRAARRQRETML